MADFPVRPVPIARRTVLKTAVQGSTLAALVSALGHAATSELEQELIGTTCLSILYRNGEGVRFDDEYYRERHMALILDRYGTAAISRYEFRKPVLVEGAEPPAYAACVNIWIEDAEAFATAGAMHGAEVAADVPNFTNASVVVQNEIIWGEAGGMLQAPVLGQTCVTILYPWAEDARWDADYYRDNHLPLIMRLYGSEAIGRFELRKSTPLPPGVNPAFPGTANCYVSDQERFATAGAEHAQTLLSDVANFSSITPMLIPTVIVGLHG